MTTVTRLLAGLVLFYGLVAKPIQANLISGVAMQYQITLQDKTLLLSHALEIQPCEPNILQELSNLYVKLDNYLMAAVTYGTAMECSPGNSWIRFQFGELLYSMGFDGLSNLKDALKLEPNNPLYKSEYGRITTLLLQLQSPTH